jgi:hypothetical protein
LNHKKMTTYSDLPYDILLHMCHSMVKDRNGGSNLSQLLIFSEIDRRTRDSAIPILFSSIMFQSEWLQVGPEYACDIIDAILGNARILDAVR